MQDFLRGCYAENDPLEYKLYRIIAQRRAVNWLVIPYVLFRLTFLVKSKKPAGPLGVILVMSS